MTAYKIIISALIILIVCSIFIYTKIIYRIARHDKLKILTSTNFVEEYNDSYTGYILVLNQHLINNSPEFVKKTISLVKKFGECLVVSISTTDNKDIYFLEYNKIFIIPTILYFEKGKKLIEWPYYEENGENQKESDVLKRIKKLLLVKG